MSRQHTEEDSYSISVVGPEELSKIFAAGTNKLEKKLSILLTSEKTDAPTKQRILNILFQIKSGKQISALYNPSSSPLVFSQKRDEEKYLRYLKQALEMGSKEAEIEIETFLQKLLQEGLYEKALETAHETNRYAVVSYYTLKEKSAQECIELCKTGLSKNPNKIQAGALHYICGLAFEDQQENQNAITHFRESFLTGDLRGGLKYYEAYKNLTPEPGQVNDHNDALIKILLELEKSIENHQTRQVDFIEELKRAAAKIYGYLSWHYENGVGVEQNKEYAKRYANNEKRYTESCDELNKINEFPCAGNLATCLKQIRGGRLTQQAMIQTLIAAANENSANKNEKRFFYEVLFHTYSQNGAILSYFETDGNKVTILFKQPDEALYKKYLELATEYESPSAMEIVKERIDAKYNKKELSDAEFAELKKECLKYKLFDLLANYYVNYKGGEEALKFLDDTLAHESLHESLKNYILVLKARILTSLGGRQKALDLFMQAYKNGDAPAGIYYARDLLITPNISKEQFSNSFRMLQKIKETLQVPNGDANKMLLGELVNIIALYHENGKGTEVSHMEASKNYLEAFLKYGNKYSEYNRHRLILRSNDFKPDVRALSAKKFEDWASQEYAPHDSNSLKILTRYELAQYYAEVKNDNPTALKHLKAMSELCRRYRIIPSEIRNAKLFYMMAQASNTGDGEFEKCLSASLEYLIKAAQYSEQDGPLRGIIIGEIKELLGQNILPKSSSGNIMGNESAKPLMETFCNNLSTIGLEEESGRIRADYLASIAKAQDAAAVDAREEASPPPKASNASNKEAKKINKFILGIINSILGRVSEAVAPAIEEKKIEEKKDDAKPLLEQVDSSIAAASEKFTPNASQNSQPKQPKPNVSGRPITKAPSESRNNQDAKPPIASGKTKPSQPWKQNQQNFRRSNPLQNTNSAQPPVQAPPPPPELNDANFPPLPRTKGAINNSRQDNRPAITVNTQKASTQNASQQRPGATPEPDWRQQNQADRLRSMRERNELQLAIINFDSAKQIEIVLEEILRDESAQAIKILTSNGNIDYSQFHYFYSPFHNSHFDARNFKTQLDNARDCYLEATKIGIAEAFLHLAHFSNGKWEMCGFTKNADEALHYAQKFVEKTLQMGPWEASQLEKIICDNIKTATQSAAWMRNLPIDTQTRIAIYAIDNAHSQDECASFLAQVKENMHFNFYNRNEEEKEIIEQDSTNLNYYAEQKFSRARAARGSVAQPKARGFLSANQQREF